MTIRMPDKPSMHRAPISSNSASTKPGSTRTAEPFYEQITREWKCRYANIWLFGHTDTVGKEDTNIELAQSARRRSATIWSAPALFLRGFTHRQG